MNDCRVIVAAGAQACIMAVGQQAGVVILALPKRAKASAAKIPVH
jgi:hypothetical protein